jgi:hypothetical protein
MRDDGVEVRFEARVVGHGTPPREREISGDLRSGRREGQDEVFERRDDPDDSLPEDLTDELWILLEDSI